MAKIRISFDLDVDLEAWAGEYGIPVAEGEDFDQKVAEDVNSYARESLVQHLLELKLGGPA